MDHSPNGSAQTNLSTSTHDYMAMRRKWHLAECAQQSGILAFNDFMQSDHRAMFLDIDLHAYFGHNMEVTASQTRRGVNSFDPQTTCQLYRKLVTEFLDRTTIEYDVRTLIATANRAKSFDHVQADALDALLKQVDEKCLRLPTDPWSPALMKMKRVHQYWKLWLTELKTKSSTQTQRDRLLYLNIGISVQEDSHPPTVRMIQTKLQATAKDLKTVRSLSADLRAESLEEKLRMELMSSDCDKKRVDALQAITNCEAQRMALTKLRTILKGNQTGALQSILVPIGDGDYDNYGRWNGSWERIFDGNKINDLLIARNRTHFSQAEGTPSTTKSMKETLGPTATNAVSRRILDGTYPIDPALPDALQSILRSLKRISPPGTIDDSISSDNVRGGYNAWRESTSTSPSNLHLRHMKALFKFEGTSATASKQDT